MALLSHACLDHVVSMDGILPWVCGVVDLVLLSNIYCCDVLTGGLASLVSW